MARKGLFDNVAFELIVDWWETNNSLENAESKGPKVGTNFPYLKKREEAWVSWREEWGDRKETEQGGRGKIMLGPQATTQSQEATYLWRYMGGYWHVILSDMTWFTFLRDGSDCLDEESMLKIKSEIGRIVYILCVGYLVYFISNPPTLQIRSYYAHLVDKEMETGKDKGTYSRSWNWTWTKDHLTALWETFLCSMWLY